MSGENADNKKIALVTGAGSGLGFATARMLAQQGWKVYGTIIECQSPEDLIKNDCIPIVVDISNLASVKKTYEYMVKECGDKGLAALINVAGLAAVAGGVIEGVSEEGIKAIFDVNVFGTLRMIRAFLPLLRKYGPARIINVSSSGFRIPVVFSGIYAITKYGVEGITNSLRYEQAPFGIQVTSIEPGAMETPMTANNEENMRKTWESMPEEVRKVYYDKLSPATSYMSSMMKTPNKPEVVAKVIIKALNVKKMKLRYIAGHDVKMIPFLQRFLGENGFERLMMKAQKLS